MSLSQVNAENITGSNTINSDSATQQVYNADDTSLTITNSSTFSPPKTERVSATNSLVSTFSQLLVPSKQCAASCHHQSVL